MIRVRRAADRGLTRLGWLDSRHSFSFGGYHDPEHQGFRALRVINDDRVAPGGGFPSHPHRDMEILTWVVEGALEHADSMGNASVIRPGEIQRMSAGTGVRHSEFNHSPEEPVRFLQVWILPGRTGLEPGYEQKSFGEAARRGRLLLLASPDAAAGGVRIHQDVSLHTALLDAGEEVRHAPAPARHAWVQVVRGEIDLNGLALEEGDGAAVSEEGALCLRAAAPAEILLFDLA